MTALHYVSENGLARITLDNPPQNRLGQEMMEGFAAAVQDLSSRDDTRALLLTAKGDDFGFGGDVSGWEDATGETFSAMIGQGLALANTFENMPFPIVVAIQGHCMGGSLELALRGDIMIAADNARFGHPEATIGAFTYLGGVQRVADRVGRTRAMQWALTAELVDAQTALSAGLVNAVVPLAELETAAEGWAQRLANGPTLAHAAHKRLLRAWSSGGVEQADALMAEMAGEILMSADAQGSMASAIDALRKGLPRPAYPFKGR